MTNNKKLIFASVIALIAVGATSALMAPKSQSAQPETVAVKPSLIVSTAKPAVAAWTTKLVAGGDIAPWQEAIVGAEIDGLRLSAVNVNVGDWVQKGQVLAEFSKDTMHQALAEQGAMVVEAEAVLAEASANANRARLVQKSGALPAQQINQLLIAERTAEAKLSAAKARRASSQLQLGYTRVLAPDDGVISARTATLGAVVSSGDELFRLIRKNRLEWRAEVTAADLADIKIAGEVILTLPDHEQIKGAVRMIAPTIDRKTRNALVYVDLTATPQVKAGMFASGEFLLGTTDALTLPHLAVVVRDGFNYVFEVDKNNRVRQVKVQVGRRQNDRIEILDGLPSDTDIVISGAGFLNDGDLVSVQAEPVNSASSGKL
ncbi:efflux RND transporter periplasmic adaptor subunit [Methylobacter sp.]|uniref:efflux RND transporter periplasmic adaptor subunit n=1 Tax=Methylobacter sp. TaxID=2051955 RepID=UPI002FDD83C0